MSKIDVVRAAMVEAMKAKDKARKDSLSMLLSALKNAEIEIIRSVLDELGLAQPTAKDKGAIMKVLMPKVKGKADGKVVNETLASMLK